jgi:Ca2+/H+ antiporter, TMEM165/GDT1 family
MIMNEVLNEIMNIKLKGFVLSFLMIMGTEIGDKTFIATMVFSRKYNKSIVLVASILPLFLMSVLSIIFGLILPNLIPTLMIQIVSTIVFLIYSVMMFREGYLSLKDQDDSKVNSNEIEEKIQTKSKIFLSIFITTFLAEWGDRSQLSTIAMTSHYNIFEILLGTSLGYLCCSSIAVFFGSFVLSKISTKRINYLGAVIFFSFSCLNLIEIYKALLTKHK